MGLLSEEPLACSETKVSPVLWVSLGNSNSLSHCSLFPFSLLFRPALLCVLFLLISPMPFSSS